MSRSDEREYNAIALQAYYAVANRHHFLRGNMIETVGVDNMNMSMSEMVGGQVDARGGRACLSEQRLGVDLQRQQEKENGGVRERRSEGEEKRGEKEREMRRGGKHMIFSHFQMNGKLRNCYNR